MSRRQVVYRNLICVVSILGGAVPQSKIMIPDRRMSDVYLVQPSWYTFYRVQFTPDRLAHVWSISRKAETDLLSTQRDSSLTQVF